MTTSSSLIALRATESTGKIICVPGAGGNVATFLDLLSALNPSWSVYGFQPRGIDLTELPDRSLQDTAERNSIELLEFGVRGDVHLIGHSYGGLVTYEMAIYLSSMGHPVTSLTMIDTEAPGFGNQVTDEASIRVKFIAALSEQFEKRLSLHERTVACSDEEAFVNEVHAVLREQKLVSDRSSPSMLRGPLALLSAALRQSYTPRCYDGRAHLALASETFSKSDEPCDWRDSSLHRWRSYVADLRASYMPGTHFSMLRAPRVSELARWWSMTVSSRRL